jgi:dTMP kinase
MTARPLPGFFITLEGGEGAGKSTHAGLLAERLAGIGREVVVTREPGGSPDAEKIRALLLGGEIERWSPTAEALLNYAAREDHLKVTIRPALARGATVVCDRFMDSTTAYQGYAGGVDLGLLVSLERAIVGESRPQLTIIFDLDPVLGLERARQRDPGPPGGGPLRAQGPRLPPAAQGRVPGDRQGRARALHRGRCRPPQGGRVGVRVAAVAARIAG